MKRLLVLTTAALLISAMGMTALGQKQQQKAQRVQLTPTPVPKAGNKSTAAICCIEWDGKGNCVRQGMVRGGACPDAPRLRQQPSDGTSYPTEESDRTGKHDTSKNSIQNFKEVAPTVTPTSNVPQRLRQQQLQVREAVTVTPTPATQKRHIAYSDDPRKEAALTVTPGDTKNSGHASESNQRDKGCRCHEQGCSDWCVDARGVIVTVTPTPGPIGSINLNSSRSNIYRVRATPTPTPNAFKTRNQPAGGIVIPSNKEEGAPVTPTSGPVEATTIKSSKANGSYREAAPTATTSDEKQISSGKGKMPPYGKEVAPVTVTPTANVLKHTESTSGGFKESDPTTPTPGPVGLEAVTVKSSKSNGSFRQTQKSKPTPTKVPAR